MKIGTLELKIHKKPKKQELIDRVKKLETNVELITKVLDAITKK